MLPTSSSASPSRPSSDSPDSIFIYHRCVSIVCVLFCCLLLVSLVLAQHAHTFSLHTLITPSSQIDTNLPVPPSLLTLPHQHQHRRDRTQPPPDSSSESTLHHPEHTQPLESGDDETINNGTNHVIQPVIPPVVIRNFTFREVATRGFGGFGLADGDELDVCAASWQRRLPPSLLCNCSTCDYQPDYALFNIHAPPTPHIHFQKIMEHMLSCSPPQVDPASACADVASQLSRLKLLDLESSLASTASEGSPALFRVPCVPSAALARCAPLVSSLAYLLLHYTPTVPDSASETETFAPVLPLQTLQVAPGPGPGRRELSQSLEWSALQPLLLHVEARGAEGRVCRGGAVMFEVDAECSTTGGGGLRLASRPRPQLYDHGNGVVTVRLATTIEQGECTLRINRHERVFKNSESQLMYTAGATLAPFLTIDVKIHRFSADDFLGLIDDLAHRPVKRYLRAHRPVYEDEARSPSCAVDSEAPSESAAAARTVSLGAFFPLDVDEALAQLSGSVLQLGRLVAPSESPTWSAPIAYFYAFHLLHSLLHSRRRMCTLADYAELDEWSGEWLEHAQTQSATGQQSPSPCVDNTIQQQMEELDAEADQLLQGSQNDDDLRLNQRLFPDWGLAVSHASSPLLGPVCSSASGTAAYRPPSDYPWLYVRRRCYLAVPSRAEAWAHLSANWNAFVMDSNGQDNARNTAEYIFGRVNAPSEERRLEYEVKLDHLSDDTKTSIAQDKSVLAPCFSSETIDGKSVSSILSDLGLCSQRFLQFWNAGIDNWDYNGLLSWQDDRYRHQVDSLFQGEWDRAGRRFKAGSPLWPYSVENGTNVMSPLWQTGPDAIVLNSGLHDPLMFQLKNNWNMNRFGLVPQPVWTCNCENSKCVNTSLTFPQLDVFVDSGAKQYFWERWVETPVSSCASSGGDGVMLLNGNSRSLESLDRVDRAWRFAMNELLHYIRKGVRATARRRRLKAELLRLTHLLVQPPSEASAAAAALIDKLKRLVDCLSNNDEAHPCLDAASSTRLLTIPLIFRSTIAPGAREFDVNPVTSAMLGQLQRRSLWRQLREGLVRGSNVRLLHVDAFDMSYPFHFDGRFSDGGHYGRHRFVPPDSQNCPYRVCIKFNQVDVWTTIAQNHAIIMMRMRDSIFNTKNQPTNQSNLSTQQASSQPGSQSTNQPTNKKPTVEQPTHQPKQPTNNQPAHQPDNKPSASNKPKNNQQTIDNQTNKQSKQQVNQPTNRQKNNP